MPLIIFWALFVVGIFAPLRYAIYMFFASLSFGALTVLPQGTINLLPFAALTPLITLKVIYEARDSQELWDAVLNTRLLGLLTAFLLVSLVITVISPIIFFGVPVVLMTTGSISPLKPTMTNVNQTAYLIASYLTCVNFYVIMLGSNGRSIVAKGLVVGALTLISSGLADVIFAGTSVLAPVRTAAYAYLVGAEVLGMRRVVGFFSEASTFGTACVSFASVMYFTRSACWTESRWWRSIQNVAIASLLLLAFFSTSSAAYLGLLVFIATGAIDFSYRLIFATVPSERTRIKYETSMFIIAAVLIFIFLSFDPEILTHISAMVDDIVLKKSQTDSFDERSSWNIDSLQGMIQTLGLGVGVGSTRASSWPVAVISCSGLMGGLLMGAFIFRSLVKYLSPGDSILRRSATGARLAFLVSAVPLAGVGTLVDFGSINAVLFAIMAGAPIWLQRALYPNDIARLDSQSAAQKRSAVCP